MPARRRSFLIRRICQHCKPIRRRRSPGSWKYRVLLRPKVRQAGHKGMAWSTCRGIANKVSQRQKLSRMCVHKCLMVCSQIIILDLNGVHKSKMSTGRRQVLSFRGMPGMYAVQTLLGSRNSVTNSNSWWCICCRFCSGWDTGWISIKIAGLTFLNKGVAECNHNVALPCYVSNRIGNWNTVLENECAGKVLTSAMENIRRT